MAQMNKRLLMLPVTKDQKKLLAILEQIEYCSSITRKLFALSNPSRQI